MTLAELGQSLKEAREAKGLSLDDVAERIKVSARILRLIEGGEQHGLPHAVYSRGFIISFANLLDYDKNALKGHLDALFPAEHLDEVQPIPLPVRGRSAATGSFKRILVLLLFLLVLGGLGYGGWFVYDTYGTTIVNLVKKPFSAISEPLPAASSPVATTGGGAPASTTPSATTVALAPAAEAPSATPPEGSINLSGTSPHRGAQLTPANDAAAGPQAQTTPQPASAALEEQAAPPKVEAPAQANLQPEGNVLAINAKSRCWVSYQTDGKQTQTFTMEPGSQHTIAYEKSLNLRLGNPSGVSLMVNGKPYEGSLRSDRALTLQFP